MNSTQQYVVLAGGRIRCRQCTAKSKRTQQQCKAPAMRTKRVCRIHGGKSTGAKTPDGKLKIAMAHTKHGQETRAIRKERSMVLGELSLIEDWMYALKMTDMPRIRGRKSNHYHAIAKRLTPAYGLKQCVIFYFSQLLMNRGPLTGGNHAPSSK